MYTFRAKTGRRAVNARRSKPRHILDVKVRSGALTARRARKIFKCLFGLSMVVAIIYGAVFGVRTGLQRFIFENPNYRLVDVSYESDGHLKRETALQIANIQMGENIFSVKLDEAQERLEALPQVIEVELHRVLPNHISIRVNERKPVAWVTGANTESQGAGEHGLLLDTNGVLIKPDELLPEYLRLPTISGVSTAGMHAGQTLGGCEVRAALDLLSISNELAPVEVRSIDLSKGYSMLVTTSARTEVTFGVERIGEQVDRLAKYLRYSEANRRELQTVNLMVQRNVPVTFMPAVEHTEESQPTPLPKAAAAPLLKAAKNEDPQVRRALPVKPKSSKSPEVRKALPVSGTKHG